VIELLLISGLSSIAVLIAAALARWALTHTEGSGEARRVNAAVARASGEFAWRMSKRGVAVTCAVGLLGATWAFIGSGSTPTPEAAAQLTSAGSQPAWAWSLGGVLLGGVLCSLSGQLAASLSARVAGRAASIALRSGQAQAIALSLRAAAATAVGTEVLALMGVFGPLALMTLGLASTYRADATLALGAAVVGAAVCAMATQFAAAAAQHAGLHTRRELHSPKSREHYELEAHNPGLILDLMGHHSGSSVVRAQNAFCTSGMLYFGLWWLVDRVSSDQASATALLLLFVLLRALGMLVSCFSVLSTRSDESDDPTLWLARGHLASIVLGLACLAGALVWLKGQSWLVWFSAGALGCIASLCLAWVHARSLKQDSGAFTSNDKDQVENVASSLTRQLGRALHACWRPLSIVAVAAILAAFMGSNAGQAHGALLALGFLLAGLCMNFTYLAALGLFEPIVDAACSVASLDPQHQRPEFQQRAQRLAQAASSAGTSSMVYFSVVTGLLGLLAVAAVPSANETLEAFTQEPQFGWAGALAGLALLLGFSGLTLRHIASCVNGVLNDLAQLLAGLPLGRDGRVELPADFRPRYNEQLLLACDRALSSRAAWLMGVVLVPWGLFALTPLLGPTSQSARILLFHSLVASTAVTATGLGLLSAAAAATLGSNRRQQRSLSTADGGIAERLAALCGHGINPTIQLVAKGVLAACFAALPFLFAVR
jgi:hypothetical protein